MNDEFSLDTGWTEQGQLPRTAAAAAQEPARKSGLQSIQELIGETQSVSCTIDGDCGPDPAVSNRP